MFSVFRRKTASKRRSPFKLRLQVLESRELMAIDLVGSRLEINDNNSGRQITVEYSPSDQNQVRARIVSSANLIVESKTYALSSVTSILVNGNGGSDTIFNLTSIPSELRGGSGNDILRGGSGNDRLYGEGDNDTYRFVGAGLGTDTIYESTGGGDLDWLDFSKFNYAVNIDLEQSTQQAVWGVSGVSPYLLYTQQLQVVLDNPLQIESVTGTREADVLRGSNGTNVLDGLAGNDTLEGRGGTNWLNGGTHDDTYIFRRNEAALNYLEENSGQGSDWLDFSEFSVGLNGLDLRDTYGQQFGQILLFNYWNIENARGTAHADVIIGNGVANKIEGLGGADTIQGLEGNDTLIGGGGNDTYVFAGTNVGDDTIKEYSGGGSDWLDYSSFGAGISLDLTLGSHPVNTAHGIDLTLTNPLEIENAKGTAFADNLRGNSHNNELHALGHNDTLEGRGGDDWLHGGSGNDTYVFKGTELGHDRIFEADDADTDTLDFSAFDQAVMNADDSSGQFSLASTAKQCLGRSQYIEKDTFLSLSSITAIENLIGSRFSDFIRGNDRDNTMRGGAGDDYLYGGDGEDTLIGEGGADHLFGEAGEDDLWGGFWLDAFADDSTEDDLDGGDDWDTYHDNSPTWWN